MTGKAQKKRKPGGTTQGETAPTDVPWYATAIEDPEVPPDEGDGDG